MKEKALVLGCGLIKSEVVDKMDEMLRFTRPVGIDNMVNIEHLPYLKKGVKIGYEGSIDKTGGNADWDWWLYREENGEWVIFDVKGPGCIYNFVQHRYHEDYDVIFRFYFDGNKSPSFEIKQSDFGKKHPFIEPLADIYDEWVHRSFVPMPFRAGCKVTSSIRLFGSGALLGEGGWGHIVYHSYDTAEGIETFTGREDYSKLFSISRNIGKDPKDISNNIWFEGKETLSRSSELTLLDYSGSGSIGSINLKIIDFKRNQNLTMGIKIYFDDMSEPFVDCPLGAFFGNELGYSNLGVITHGMEADGSFYFYYPMPFWERVKIILINDAGAQNLKGYLRNGIEYKIGITPSEIRNYLKSECGYFHIEYNPMHQSIYKKDTVVGKTTGSGHCVGGLVTTHKIDFVKGNWTCEGDVRIHIDGIKTPQVYSDGSESWASYGWGFPTPPESTPFTGYDGDSNNYTWSMIKTCIADWYPFYGKFNFNIEHGGMNDLVMHQSGTIYFYKQEKPSIRLTDSINIANLESELEHNYCVTGDNYISDLGAAFEGESVFFTQKVIIRDSGRYFNGSSEFTVMLNPDNRGIRLRRRCDQERSGMQARVYIDGKHVTERDWYWADRNPFLRWLEDDFEVPSQYTKGKNRARIKIEYIPCSHNIPGGEELAPVSYKPGIFGEAVVLSTSIQGTINSKISNDLSGKPVSLEFWIKSERINEHSDMDIVVLQDEEKNEIILKIENGTLMFNYNTEEIVLNNKILEDKEWHFASIYLSEISDLELYVDNIKLIVIKNFNLRKKKMSLYIGRHRECDRDRETSVLLDDMRLSAIKQQKEIPSAELSIDTGTIGLWRFDRDNTGLKITDYSENGNHIMRYNTIPQETSAKYWNEFRYEIYCYI